MMMMMKEKNEKKKKKLVFNINTEQLTYQLNRFTRQIIERETRVKPTAWKKKRGDAILVHREVRNFHQRRKK